MSEFTSSLAMRPKLHPQPVSDFIVLLYKSRNAQPAACMAIFGAGHAVTPPGQRHLNSSDRRGISS